MTIQIVPVSALGKDQEQSIRQNYKEARPVFISADTKRSDPDIWESVRRRKYTHIILGPEQAASKEFRMLLAEPEFKSNIALVAIDEMHAVVAWADFREKYTLISELRRILTDRVPIFGCTATLTREQEIAAKESISFNLEGPNLYNLKIIRVCINRPNITIQAVQIPQGALKSF